MDYFKISREDLEIIIQKSYEEGSYGYMDLKDSVCNRLLREFLDSHSVMSPENNDLVVIENVTYDTNGSITETPANFPDSVNSYYEMVGLPEYTIVDNPIFFSDPNYSPINIQRIDGTHSVIIQTQEFNPERNSSAPEEIGTHVRISNYNFNGNESERL